MLSVWRGYGCECVRVSQALSDVYYEPLAEVLPSVDAILAGPPVMKLLFMTHPTIVDSKLKPDWQVTYHACVHMLSLGLASCVY